MRAGYRIHTVSTADTSIQEMGVFFLFFFNFYLFYLFYFFSIFSIFLLNHELRAVCRALTHRPETKGFKQHLNFVR